MAFAQPLHPSGFTELSGHLLPLCAAVVPAQADVEVVLFFPVNVREDPECRLHGQVGMCNRPAPGLPPRGPEPSPTLTTAVSPPEVTLDQKTAFVTAGGLHLLYDPEALDKWIAKRMELCDEGGHMDTQTGEKLSGR